VAPRQLELFAASPPLDPPHFERWRALAAKPLFVLANNKAEGSSPLTIAAIAERLAAGA
jgi:hypothetical protein